MIIFATGNHQKLQSAQDVCRKYNFEVQQLKIVIDEIQHEDPLIVATDKAKKAFQLSGCPVVITDDSWNFPGLKGFPGVYMHSMNLWFTAEDFLRLTATLDDRRAFLTQHLVYYDGEQTKVFSQTSDAILIKEIRGYSIHPSHMITSFDHDNGKSIAETYDQASDKSDRKSAVVWHEFAKWYVTLNQAR